MALSEEESEQLIKTMTSLLRKKETRIFHDAFNIAVIQWIRGILPISGGVDKIKKGIISINPCHACTAAPVVQPLTSAVTMEEARRISEKAAISWSDWMSSYINNRWQGKESFILRRINNRCIFLKQVDDQYLCSIHTFKPDLCIEWQEGMHRHECRQGLKRRWDITIDTDGNLTGTADALQSFRSFLESLRDY
jgi:Fe-S-cluster containining protein